jgi:hypothetical protein
LNSGLPPCDTCAVAKGAASSIMATESDIFKFAVFMSLGFIVLLVI